MTKFMSSILAVTSAASVFGLSQVDASTNATSSFLRTSSTTVSKQKMLSLLPKGAELISSNADGNLIQQVDLNNDAKKEYTALYEYPLHGAQLIGAVVVANDNGTLKKLWQYNGKVGLVKPASLSMKDVQNDGKTDIVFKSGIGAMADYYDVLAWENGNVKSIFQTSSYRMDIGMYGDTHSNQIITWNLDTGLLYQIQVYGWNSKEAQFEPTTNRTAPKYFKNIVIPYYKHLANSSQGKQAPKMIAYGLAQAYFDAGEYQSALSEIQTGLKSNANDYPPNSDFVTLKNQIESKR